MNRETVKKALAFAVCALFIMVTLLSAMFVFAHAGHEHDHDGFGGNCTACTHLAAAGNMLKVIAVALACQTFGFGGFSAVRPAIKAACFRAVLFTLVHRKIKLNN